MVKWLSKVAGNRGKSLVPSTIITLFIVAMLIISGPAQAVAVNIAGLDPSYTKGEDVDFQIKIDINDPDQYVSITNISLDLNGPVKKTIFFTLDGKQISPGCNIEITPVSIPKDDFGYGNGYGYDTRAGYGYDLGYGYGYGYGYGGGGGAISFIYDVSIHTATNCLPAGTYGVVASLNTGKDVAFKSPSLSFSLKKGMILNASVEIKPETLNLASKGMFTAFITSKEFDIEKINGSTVRIITCCDSANAVNWNTADKKFIAKFRTQDLDKVQTGNEVEFTVTGELLNGTKFEGSDTIKVIDKANGPREEDDEECECGDQVKEHDHKDECDHKDDCEDEDECGDHVEKQENKVKKEKDQSSDKNKGNGQKNKNNGGQGNNVVINNINIYDNTGTVNVNVYNQGSDTVVNQAGNYQKEKTEDNGNSKNQGSNGKGKSKSNNNKGKK
jgi:hypothetical protein